MAHRVPRPPKRRIPVALIVAGVALGLITAGLVIAVLLLGR